MLNVIELLYFIVSVAVSLVLVGICAYHNFNFFDKL